MPKTETNGELRTREKEDTWIIGETEPAINQETVKESIEIENWARAAAAEYRNNDQTYLKTIEDNFQPGHLHPPILPRTNPINRVETNPPDPLKKQISPGKRTPALARTAETAEVQPRAAGQSNQRGKHHAYEEVAVELVGAGGCSGEGAPECGVFCGVRWAEAEI
jgi:hypothetical protein